MFAVVIEKKLDPPSDTVAIHHHVGESYSPCPRKERMKRRRKSSRLSHVLVHGGKMVVLCNEFF